MSWVLSAEAEQEVADALAFYSERASAAVARAFLAEFTRAADLIAEHPSLGTPTSRSRRLFPLHRFPYSLLYSSVADEGVRIVAVAHQRRRPGYWRQRK